MSSTTITIQPGQPGNGMDYDVRRPLPYPFHIDAATGDCVRGRGTDELDLPAGHKPWRLLGFQADKNVVQGIHLPFTEFSTDPQKAVGMYPTFLDHSESMFSTTTPITSVQVSA